MRTTTRGGKVPGLLTAKRDHRSRGGFPRQSVTAALFLVVAGTSCDQLLDEVTVQRRTRSGDPLPLSASPQQSFEDPSVRVQPGELCEPASIECAGPALQQCADNGEGWVTLQICASDALCSAEGEGACGLPTCGFGELRCEGANLEMCDATRTGWQVLEACEASAFCSTTDRGCRTTPCEAGERQCSGGALQVCRTDQSDWDKGASCASQALCVESLDSNASVDTDQFVCKEPTCAPGERQCSGARLEQCNFDQTGWALLDTCSSDTLCDAGLTSCSSIACSVGEARCGSEGALQRCRADQSGFDTERECYSSAFCSVESQREGCEVTPCSPDALRCNGAQVERCRSDREGYDAVGDRCVTSALCIEQVDGAGVVLNASCDSPACARNQYQCAGNQLQRCNEGRTGYVWSADCETPELCSGALQRCEPARCNAEETRCSGATLERCNAGQTGFEPIEVCDGAAECDSVLGVCAEACQVGATRCNGAELEECRDQLLGWQRVAFCASAALCDAEAGTCQERVCQAGQFQCTGQSLQQCAPGLDQFVELQLCGAGESCDSVAGDCDVCTAGELQCDGDTLRRCSSDGQGLDEIVTCNSGLCRVEGETGRCLECTPGTSRCQGAIGLVCDAQGRESELVQCASAAQCQVQGAEVSCADTGCALGELSCGAGGEVLTCNAARTAFTSQDPAVFCPATAQCDPTTVGGCLAAGEEATPVDSTEGANLPDYAFELISNSDFGSGVVNGLGPLFIEAPTEWSQLDGSPWAGSNGESLGPGLLASPDVAIFRAGGFTVPGVFIGATQATNDEPANILDTFQLQDTCSFESRAAFVDSGHVGLFDIWRNCDGTTTTAVTMAARPAQGNHLVVILAKLQAPRDQVALDRIWSTFSVGNDN